MITVERLTVRYGRTVAVDAIDAVIPSGSTVGLIGPNGSGKSSLLRSLFGAVEPASGSVLVDGERVRRMTPAQRARRFAVVAQEEPSGFPLRAWDSVLLGRSARLSAWSSYGIDDERAATDAMERAGVIHLAHRHIDDLSGGERQRVLIARALAQGASHLLLDEPTNHLDVRFQHEILSLVQSLPTTSVVVLHDLNLAARYCDELILLNAGAIVASGSSHDVLAANVLEPVYGISVTRVSVGGAPQLLFAPQRG